MSERDRLTAADIAGRYHLQRRRPNEWRGACPCCGYATAFVVTNKGGLPLFWCANGCPKCELVKLIFGESDNAPRAAVGGPPKRDRAELAAMLFKVAQGPCDSPVSAYLHSRALELPPEDVLRFEPRARHPNKMELPAMRAAVRDSSGKIIALHSTYLRADGAGKAAIDPVRSTLGNTRGGAVHLFPAASSLILAEGIETALSAAVLLGFPAWAALSAGNLSSSIVPPSDVREIIVAVDNDVPGRKAAHEAAARLRALGFAVKVAIPDTPGDDFNDVLMRRRGKK
jgi:putative DNA primase/helicase